MCLKLPTYTCNTQKAVLQWKELYFWIQVVIYSILNTC